MADGHQPSIIPTMTYDDPKAAIDWLVTGFGFEAKEVHEDGGVVVHAELTWGNGMLMLGARQEGSPFAIGPQAIYFTTDDPDGLHDRAVAAGADIFEGLTDRDYGSREFIARDTDGNLWCFGTYSPTVG